MRIMKRLLLLLLLLLLYFYYFYCYVFIVVFFICCVFVYLVTGYFVLFLFPGLFRYGCYQSRLDVMYSSADVPYLMNIVINIYNNNNNNNFYNNNNNIFLLLLIIIQIVFISFYTSAPVYVPRLLKYR